MSFTPGAGTRFLLSTDSSGTISPSGPLSITGGTATTNTPVLSATQTWNNAAVTFTGWRLNVTDTASNANSLLMDLQTGGTSLFRVTKDGLLRLPYGTGTPNNGGPPAIQLLSGANVWGAIFAHNGGTSGGGICLSPYGSLSTFLNVGANQVSIGGSMPFGWASSSGNVQVGLAVALWQEGGTLAQRNGVNAQTFRLYNTYTDASNYERGKIEWVSNILTIGTEKAGTGTARALDFQTDGTSRWSIAATSNNLTSNMGGAGIVGFEGGSVFCASGSVFKSRGIAYLDSTTGDVHLRPGGVTALLATSSGIAVTGFTEMTEQTAPAAPAANSVRIYAEDNGSGKTRLMARFATGAAQQIAIEP